MKSNYKTFQTLPPENKAVVPELTAIGIERRRRPTKDLTACFKWGTGDISDYCSRLIAPIMKKASAKRLFI